MLYFLCVCGDNLHVTGASRIRGLEGMKMNSATLIRKYCKCGQHGHERTPDNLYMSDSKDNYCDYYWSPLKWDCTHAEYSKAAKVLTRYKRFYRYMTEVKPAWKEVRKVYYADNSVESEQVDLHGNTRSVMIETPHGDVCF